MSERARIRQALAEGSKKNIVDRIVSYFDPIAGANRERARMFSALAGGYTGASKNRRSMQEWQTSQGASADSDLLPDLPALRDRSRDLLRNSPLASGAVSGVVTSVVGTGLALHSKVDAKVLRLNADQAEELQNAIEAEFGLWSESTACDAQRTLDFCGLQSLVFRSALESGDVFPLLPMRSQLLPFMPYALCVNVIESDRVANPGLGADTNKRAGGVELDELGAPIAYHFRKILPGSIHARYSTECDRVEAFGAKTGRRQVLHVYDKLRPGQTRGAPYLAPVIETLKQLDRYSEAELMAAVISSMFTVFVKSERGGLDPLSTSGIAGETGQIGSDKDVKLASGAILDLGAGESIEIANPMRPNPAFEGFVMALCREIGVALELPYEVLIKHFTASYSAARGALLEAWKLYRRKRVWLATTFCQPTFEAFLDEAVARGRIAAPGYFSDPLWRRAYLKSEWVGDGPISLDPGKDVEAARGRMELGISTLEKETMLHDGGDWQSNHQQRVIEVNARRRDGLEIEPAAPGAAAAPGAGAAAGSKGSDLETAPTQNGGNQQ